MGANIQYCEKLEQLQPADALIRFVSEAELQGEGDIVQPQIDRAIKGLYAKKLFKAEPEQAESIPTLGLHPAEHIVFAGLSPEEGMNGLRKGAAAAARELKRLRAKNVSIIFPQEELYAAAGQSGAARCAQALAEGLLLALHEREPMLRIQPELYELQNVQIHQLSENGKQCPEEWRSGIERGSLYAKATAYARDLTNLPGNELTPERLAYLAEELAREADLEIEVIDEWTASEQGMGGLLGVGQGSVNPPRMIVIHYNGAPDSEEKWGLIGKGITFDTGGISLKRAAGMEEMITDMGGAASVLGAMLIVGERKPAVNIVAVIPTAENMPSDRALKPGDVIRMMSGHTVEIINTDAEGRLVLADGVTTAIRRGATKLVDVATLTGAVVAALGNEVTGAVANNDALMKRVLEASVLAGERIWEMPSYPEYKRQLKSSAADLRNGGYKQGRMMTAGLFIGFFAEELPWVHLDIAGTARLESNRGWENKGATGVMVRTLAELIEA